MSALAHDERCEGDVVARNMYGQPIRTNERIYPCRCAERALVAARRREEEAKGKLDDALTTCFQAGGMYAKVALERDALRAEITRLTRAASEKDGQIAAWIDTAAQESRNRDYYRALVVEIGELFGVAARTADDGGIDDDVLCAKVPELVRAQALAASESARTLQVEIAQLQADIREHDLDREGFKNMALEKAAQVTALREVLSQAHVANCKCAREVAWPGVMLLIDPYCLRARATIPQDGA